MPRKGEKFECEECGLVVMVWDPCDCDECDLICCEVPMSPMKETKPRKKSKTSKKPVKKPAKKKAAS